MQFLWVFFKPPFFLVVMFSSSFRYRFNPHSCFNSVTDVDSASITAKSNLSNLCRAEPSTLRCCLCVWSPTNEMCDKATEVCACVLGWGGGCLLGIIIKKKTDFCTLKWERIKNNRGVFVVQRKTLSPFIRLRSFLHLFFVTLLSCHMSQTGPQPAPPPAPPLYPLPGKSSSSQCRSCLCISSGVYTTWSNLCTLYVC